MLHLFVTRIQQLAKSQTNLSPAFVESYSRLLVYTETESLGVESLVSKYNRHHHCYCHHHHYCHCHQYKLTRACACTH